jgi:hypothetical protein
MKVSASIGSVWRQITVGGHSSGQSARIVVSASIPPIEALNATKRPFQESGALRPQPLHAWP